MRKAQHGTRTEYGYGCRCAPCREANREYLRQRYANDPEKVLDQQRRWREANPGRALEYSRRYREASPERARESRRRWYVSNRERAREATRRWQDSSPEQVAFRRRANVAKRQAESALEATRLGDRWEPYEDALLARISSNIAAASALGRTVSAVVQRRYRLRAKEALV